MAPNTRESGRKIVTPKPIAKTAKQDKATVTGPTHPTKHEPGSEPVDGKDASAGDKKSRKRAADFMEIDDGGEVVEKKSDKKAEKPKKKPKTSTGANAKSSKAGSRTAEAEKISPESEMDEVEPSKASAAKKAKDTSKKAKAAEPSSKVTDGKKDKLAEKVTGPTQEKPSKKKPADKAAEGAKEKSDEKAAAATNAKSSKNKPSKKDFGAEKDVATVAASSKDKKAKKSNDSEVAAAPVDDAATETLPDAPQPSENGTQKDIIDVAESSKSKPKKTKKSSEPNKAAADISAKLADGGGKKESKAAAKDKVKSTAKAPKKHQEQNSDNKALDDAPGAPKPEAAKSKKRKAAEDRTVDAVKSNLLDPLSEGAATKKKQKKSQPNPDETVGSKVSSLLSSGLEAAAQGANAAKDFLSDLTGGAHKSITDDVREVALGVVEEKAKAEKKSKQPSKKGKGKSKAVESEETNGLSDVKETPGGIETADATKIDANGLEAIDEDDAEDDQTAALLKGFQSDDEDEVISGDEGFKPGQDLPGLPKKTGLSKELKKASSGSDSPGVVYVGRIPHGFHEHEMRAYFLQFGKVNHVRLSRSKKTGNSKHYAFIEFASSDVAKIVADTMNNYLMFGHILKCNFVPKEQVHADLWKGADKRFKTVPWTKIEGRKLEVAVGRDQWKKRVSTENKRRSEKAEKLKAIGYELDAAELEDVDSVPVKAKSTAIEDAAPGASTEGVVEVEQTLITAETENGTLIVTEEVKKTKQAGKGKKAKDIIAAITGSVDKPAMEEERKKPSTVVDAAEGSKAAEGKSEEKPARAKRTTKAKKAST